MSSVIEFISTYFTSRTVLSVLALNFGLITSLYLIFRIKRGDSAVRSQLLTGTFLLSIYNWIFIAAGLVFCQLLIQDYEANGYLAVKRVLGLALITGVTAVFPLSIFMTRRLPRVILQRLGALGEPSLRSSQIFSTIRQKASDMHLREVQTSSPISFAVQGTGVGTVVVSSSLLDLLDDHELEAVMAHEVGHIRNGDAQTKTLLACYKFLIRFDPFVRLIEPAFHREREFEADKFSALLTKKPLALASALLKIHEAVSSKLPAYFSQLSIVSKGRGLLDRSPPIDVRIERLLKMNDLPQ